MKKMCRVAAVLLPVSLLFSACSSKADRCLEAAGELLDSLEATHVTDSRIIWWETELTMEEGEVVLEGSLANRDLYALVVKAVDKEFPEVRNELVLLPEEGDGRLVNGLVNNSVCHLRKTPSSKTELVTQTLLGTPVRILKEGPGKVLIQVPDGYLGWTNASEVHALSKEEMSAYKASEKLIYNRQYGTVYSEPDKASLPVSDLVLGCIMPLVEEKGDFFQVSYPDGRLGWVLKEEVIDAKKVFFHSPVKEDLVNTALPYNGVPYLWGGTSTKNIDCSGFVSNVYYMNGIQLPRDADPQSYCGKLLTEEFSAEGLEAGDLLFFGRKATEESEERVTHVGMYIGDGLFMHSAGWRDRVSINTLDSLLEGDFIESYPRIFIRAMRILGEEPIGFAPLAENAFYKEIIHTEDEE